MRKAKRYGLAFLLMGLVLCGGLCLSGCILKPVQLTPEEKVEHDLIVEKLTGAVENLNDAADKSASVVEVTRELVEKHKDLAGKVTDVIEAVREGRVPAAEGMALVEKLRRMKADIDANLPALTEMGLAAKADLEAARAAFAEVKDDAKAFEKRVADRVEREGGERPSGFAIVLGTILSLATGGGALTLIARIRTLLATLRRLRAAFKVTAGALADPKGTDGKASEEGKARIRAGLALTSDLNEDELEVLRTAAMKE